MARPIILGNGALTVGLDESGLVHDFYFPYVGLDNLTNQRSMHHRIGVWIDQTFSWVDDGTWDTHIELDSDALVSHITMIHHELSIELQMKDFVDSDMNLFGRIITIVNNSDDKREVRLFMHQVFEISRDGRADTALYVPDGNYILDYKGRTCLLISGLDKGGQPYDQFAIGNHGIEGKAGTFVDAEDGELSGSTVEHGGVDSVLRFMQVIEPHDTTEINYWVIAGDSQQAVEHLNRAVIAQGLQGRLSSTEHFWQKWLSVGINQLHITDKNYLELTKKSLMLIKAHIDKRGGIIAGIDSSIYNYGRDYYSYVWPRDGAYAIWPLIRLGYTEEPKKFFEFCRDITNPAGYLMHKYQPDRAIGSTWHPLMHGKEKELAIQEDETAIVLFMLGEYFDISQDADFIKEMFPAFIEPAANFLCSFIDVETGLPHASYDLWEQKFSTSTYTVATVYQALLTAADFADYFKKASKAQHWRDTANMLYENRKAFVNPDTNILRKGFYFNPDSGLEFDECLDVSSFYGSFMFGYFHKDPPILSATIEAVETVLTGENGVARYDGDDYFRVYQNSVGNPWVICTLWLAQFYIRVHKPDQAHEILHAISKTALNTGVLSEQLDPQTGRQISVSPLVWSHAEYINTILDISKIN